MNEFNGYSRNYWVKAIQLDLVKVNGRTVDTSYKFKDRDVLSHITHRHEPVVNGDIEMIEDNDEFILVNKPAQLPVHPGGSYRFNSLTEILAKELILLNKTELHLVHRLDRLTSGLVLLAKSKQFANEMCQLIKDRKLKKTYLARVEGVFPNNMTNIPQLSLEQVLDNDVNNNKVFGYRNLTDTSGVSVLYLRCPIGLVDSKSGRYECNANDSKFAISSFQLVSYCNQTNTSLLQCGLITGRSQQLRLHLQFLGNPICNDFEYGGTIRYDEEKLSQLIASVRDYGVNFEPTSSIYPVKYLLTYPVDADVNDESTESYVVSLNCLLSLPPLHLAAYLGAEFAILPLLKAKANKYLRVRNSGFEFSNKTASEIALQRGYHNISLYIDKYDDVELLPYITSGSESLPNSPSSSKVMLKRITSNEFINPAVSTLDNSLDSQIKQSDSFVDIILDSNQVSSKIDQVVNESNGKSTSNSLKKATSPPIHGIGSHPGYKSPTEDRIVVNELIDGSLYLYAVFDGHGGSHYAEDFSRFLPDRLKKAFDSQTTNGIESTKGSQSDKKTKIDLSPEEIESTLISEIILLDSELVNRGDSSFQYTKGGSTAVCVIVTPSHVIIANVGDSPAVAFTSSGKLLFQTEDHCPDNPKEFERVKKLGAEIACSNEFGDLRVQSGRGQLTVTRAIGQYEFKKNKSFSNQIVTSLPQTYIWERFGDVAIDFLAIYSDSLTEALRDHRAGKIIPMTGRPEQVIGNFLTNEDALQFIFPILQSNNYSVDISAKEIALKQVKKFHMFNSFFGDNTSIVLVDLRQVDRQADTQIDREVDI
eukprot:gene18326-24016_t